MRGRLPWLLPVLAVLLALRWWDWRSHHDDQPMAVAEAVVRPGNRATAEFATVAAQASRAAISMRELDVEEPRNAFAARTPPAPPAPPPAPPSPPPVKPFVGPPLPPPPFVASAPPLRVIGTWDDASGPSVFLAGSITTLRARVGDVLLSDYRVVQITGQQVLFRHTPSNQEVRLPVPAASTSPTAGRF